MIEQSLLEFVEQVSVNVTDLMDRLSEVTQVVGHIQQSAQATAREQQEMIDRLLSIIERLDQRVKALESA